MKIYQTLIFFPDDPNASIRSCDTIEYQGAYWLVPQWIENPAEETRSPLRLVRMDLFPYQDDRAARSPYGHFVMTQGITREVFDGCVQSLGGKQAVIENPPIRLPIRR